MQIAAAQMSVSEVLGIIAAVALLVGSHYKQWLWIKDRDILAEKRMAIVETLITGLATNVEKIEKKVTNGEFVRNVECKERCQLNHDIETGHERERMDMR